jgi:hypothetical protein
VEKRGGNAAARGAGRKDGSGVMRVMILTYQSGEEIRKGDRILFHGNPPEIEFVASDPLDSDQAWYVREYGGGVMILDPVVSGSTFIAAKHIGNYEDLEFVSRANAE